MKRNAAKKPKRVHTRNATRKLGDPREDSREASRENLIERLKVSVPELNWKRVAFHDSESQSIVGRIQGGADHDLAVAEIIDDSIFVLRPLKPSVGKWYRLGRHVESAVTVVMLSQWWSARGEESTLPITNRIRNVVPLSPLVTSGTTISISIGRRRAEVFQIVLPDEGEEGRPILLYANKDLPFAPGFNSTMDGRNKGKPVRCWSVEEMLARLALTYRERIAAQEQAANFFDRLCCEMMSFDWKHEAKITEDERPVHVFYGVPDDFASDTNERFEIHYRTNPELKITVFRHRETDTTWTAMSKHKTEEAAIEWLKNNSANVKKKEQKSDDMEQVNQVPETTASPAEPGRTTGAETAAPAGGAEGTKTSEAAALAGAATEPRVCRDDEAALLSFSTTQRRPGEKTPLQELVEDLRREFPILRWQDVPLPFAKDGSILGDFFMPNGSFACVLRLNSNNCSVAVPGKADVFDRYEAFFCTSTVLEDGHTRPLTRAEMLANIRGWIIEKIEPGYRKLYPAAAEARDADDAQSRVTTIRNIANEPDGIAIVLARAELEQLQKEVAKAGLQVESSLLSTEKGAYFEIRIDSEVKVTAFASVDSPSQTIHRRVATKGEGLEMSHNLNSEKDLLNVTIQTVRDAIWARDLLPRLRDFFPTMTWMRFLSGVIHGEGSSKIIDVSKKNVEFRSESPRAREVRDGLAETDLLVWIAQRVETAAVTDDTMASELGMIGICVALEDPNRKFHLRKNALSAEVFGIEDALVIHDNQLLVRCSDVGPRENNVYDRDLRSLTRSELVKHVNEWQESLERFLLWKKAGKRLFEALKTEIPEIEWLEVLKESQQEYSIVAHVLQYERAVVIDQDDVLAYLVTDEEKGSVVLRDTLSIEPSQIIGALRKWYDEKAWYDGHRESHENAENVFLTEKDTVELLVSLQKLYPFLEWKTWFEKTIESHCISASFTNEQYPWAESPAVVSLNKENLRIVLDEQNFATQFLTTVPTKGKSKEEMRVFIEGTMNDVVRPAHAAAVKERAVDPAKNMEEFLEKRKNEVLAQIDLETKALKESFRSGVTICEKIRDGEKITFFYGDSHGFSVSALIEYNKETGAPVYSLSVQSGNTRTTLPFKSFDELKKEVTSKVVAGLCAKRILEKLQVAIPIFEWRRVDWSTLQCFSDSKNSPIAAVHAFGERISVFGLQHGTQRDLINQSDTDVIDAVAMTLQVMLQPNKNEIAGAVSLFAICSYLQKDLPSADWIFRANRCSANVHDVKDALVIENDEIILALSSVGPAKARYSIKNLTLEELAYRVKSWSEQLLSVLVWWNRYTNLFEILQQEVPAVEWQKCEDHSLPEYAIIGSAFDRRNTVYIDQNEFLAFLTSAEEPGAICMREPGKLANKQIVARLRAWYGITAKALAGSTWFGLPSSARDAAGWLGPDRSEEISEAGWRVAGSQATRLSTDAMIGLLARLLGLTPGMPEYERLLQLLRSAGGKAAVAFLLSMVLERAGAERLAHELGVQAMERIADGAIDVVMAPVREFVAALLRGESVEPEAPHKALEAPPLQEPALLIELDTNKAIVEGT